MKKFLIAVLASVVSVSFAAPSFQLSSPDFAANQAMPKVSGCHSKGQSPALAWSGEPIGTKSFALIVTDPDAIRVSDKPFEHWVVYKIPASVHAIQRGDETLPQGLNSSDDDGFYPFCPPDGMHHYDFVLYALNSDTIHYPTDLTAAKLRRAIQGHVLAQASLMGTFSLENRR